VQIPIGGSNQSAYGTGAVTVFEFPWLLDRVTETEATADVLPETVKGWVRVNWLPYGAAAVLPYHVVNKDVVGMVKVVDESVVPAAGVN